MYGFNKGNEVSIPEVFKLIPQDFSQHVDNRNIYLLILKEIQHAEMQNGKIWLLTMKNKIIIKANFEDSNDRKREVDHDLLKRKNIEKMYVDPKGLHCFMLAEHEIYYNHWKSNVVYLLNVNSSGGTHFKDQPEAYKSIDIFYVTPNDPDAFEIILGTETGGIYHSCIVYQDKQGIQIIEPFIKVLDTKSMTPILDMKICKILDRFLILAVTDSILF